MRGSAKLAFGALIVSLLLVLSGNIGAFSQLVDEDYPLRRAELPLMNKQVVTKVQGYLPAEPDEEVVVLVRSSKPLTGLLKSIGIEDIAFERFWKGEFVVAASLKFEQLSKIAEKDYVKFVNVRPNPKLEFEQLLEKIRIAEPEIPNYVETDLASIREFLGATLVEQELGFTGKGVRVAVIDTGVDFSNPDIRGALDYFQEGNIREPLVYDAEQSHVSLLQLVEPVGDSLPVAGMSFDVAIPYLRGVIAQNDYAVNASWSKSGKFAFGMTLALFPLGNRLTWVRTGIVMYDPDNASDYTALRIDVNMNFNFTDDPEVTYFGERIVDPYFDPEEGRWLFGGVVVGGFFYDWAGILGLFPLNYPGWDRQGRYVSLFYDWNSHGTFVASAATSRGVQSYQISGIGNVTLKGIAPGAKVIAVKALFLLGNVEAGLLWASGFDIDLETGSWFYTGSKRADVLSNSWGISTQPYDIAGFGYDMFSMFMNGLATPGFLSPDYKGIIVVKSAGNGGAGYGTVTSPVIAAGINVGASTAWHVLGMFGFNSSEQRFDDVIDWSSRGPSPVGDIKPDLVNVGAFAFVPGPLTVGGFGIFGGTSLSAPLTAGVIALMIEANPSLSDDPGLVKAVLQSTSRDLGYNPLVQGSGRVDAFKAVTLASKLAGEDVGPVTVLVKSTLEKHAKVIGGAWEIQWGKQIPSIFLWWYRNGLPESAVKSPSMPGSFSNIATGSLYVGRVGLGKVGFSFLVDNPNPFPVTIERASANVLKRFATETLSGTFSFTNETLKREFFVIDRESFVNDTLTAFRLAYSYSDFDPGNDYSFDYLLLVYIYGWRDLDGDGDVDYPSELSRFNYGINFGTTKEALVSRVYERLRDGEKLAVEVRGINLIKVPREVEFSLRVDHYTEVEIPAEFSNLGVIEQGSSRRVFASLEVKLTDPPTVREGKVKILLSTPEGDQLVNVAFAYNVVAAVIGVRTLTPILGIDVPDDEPYSFANLRGMFDWSWRFESGDWRLFFIRILAPRVAALDIRAFLEGPTTSADIFTLAGNGLFAGNLGDDGVPSKSAGFWYLGSGRFVWHRVGPLESGPSGFVSSLPSTNFVNLGWPGLAYPHRFEPREVFTVYIHETIHSGNSVSERFWLTVRVVSFEEGDPRLPEVLEAKVGSNVTAKTSVRVPSEVKPVGFRLGFRMSPESVRFLARVYEVPPSQVIVSDVEVKITDMFEADDLVATPENLVFSIGNQTVPGDYYGHVIISVSMPSRATFYKIFWSNVLAYTYYSFYDFTIIRVSA